MIDKDKLVARLEERVTFAQDQVTKFSLVIGGQGDMDYWKGASFYARSLLQEIRDGQYAHTPGPAALWIVEEMEHCRRMRDSYPDGSLELYKVWAARYTQMLI